MEDFLNSSESEGVIQPFWRIQKLLNIFREPECTEEDTLHHQKLKTIGGKNIYLVILKICLHVRTHKYNGRILPYRIMIKTLKFDVQRTCHEQYCSRMPKTHLEEKADYFHFSTG